MSALVKKEMRLLLPGWIGLILAATLPLWVWREAASITTFVFYGAILVVALSPIGQEINSRTFGLLLVQPQDRRRFWRAKVSLLALAAGSGWLLFMCGWIYHGWDNGWDILVQSPLIVALAISGGLWTTLLFRDVVTAFLTTCVVPAALAALTLFVISHFDDLNQYGIGGGAVASASQPAVPLELILYILGWVYAIAGYFWARRLFLRAQDLPWTGGLVTLKMLPIPQIGLTFTRKTNRWIALIKNELRGQDIVLFIIVVLSALHVVAVIAYFRIPKSRSPDELTLIAVPMIWMVAVPALIGCATVAEERRHGTLDGLLCLPVSKKASFAVKFVTMLLLAVVVGGVAPSLLVALAYIWAHIPQDHVGFLHGWPMCATAAAIALIGFYASTISRGLLQALPTALVIPTLAGMVLAVYSWMVGYRDTPYGGTFFQSYIYPATLILGCVVAAFWLSFRNYTRLQLGWRVWVGDGVRVAIMLVGCSAVAAGIYNRDWQLFEKLEPPHGPARISGPGRADLRVSGSKICILLPDGRLWSGHIIWSTSKTPDLHGISGAFLEGTDWVKISGNSSIYALKADGSVWELSNIHVDDSLNRFGSDSDWADISASGSTVLAVKQNGTLWGWGENQYNVIDPGLPESPAGRHEKPPQHLGVKKNQKEEPKIVAKNIPVRLGTETDWAKPFLLQWGQIAIGIKNDGKAWQWGWLPGPFNASVSAKRGFPLTGTNWQAMAMNGWTGVVAVSDDGTLWKEAGSLSPVFGMRAHENAPAVRLGTKSDWVNVNGDWQIDAIESDGTLWAQNYGLARHPSRYQDWIAAAGPYGTWALARDGTLSAWQEFVPPEVPDKPTFWQRFALGPDRHPVISTNIFDASH